MVTFEALLFAGVIFALRVLNYSVSTFRTVMITRGKKLISAVLAFVEAFIFAVVIANVVSDLQNAPNLIAYCMGAAVGGYIGMALEDRFITHYVTVNVITPNNGHDLAVALRDRGYGVTETVGEGHKGTVTMLRSVIDKKDVTEFLRVIRTLDSTAFVAVEEARAVQHGWLRSTRNRGLFRR
jgi:uncharacterized protein YebE (UPF0316 family)